MIRGVMKISLRNFHPPSRAISILVYDRLKALGKLRPIREANLTINHSPADSLGYQIRLELEWSGEPLSATAESHSFRAAFDRVLLQLQTRLLRCRSHTRTFSKHIQ
jgi:ribosome-associated translation inhibitor RaiA